MYIFLVISVFFFNLYIFYYSKKKNYLLIVWRLIAFVVSVSFLFIYYFYINRFENNNFDSENNWSIYLESNESNLIDSSAYDKMLTSAILIENSFNKLVFNNPSLKENLLPLNQSIRSNTIQKCSTDTINKYLHIENNIIIGYNEKDSKISVSIMIDGDNELTINSENPSLIASKVISNIFKEVKNRGDSLDEVISSSKFIKKKGYYINISSNSDFTIFRTDKEYNYCELNDFFKNIKSNREDKFKTRKFNKLYEYIRDTKLVNKDGKDDFETYRYRLLNSEIALFIGKYDVAYSLISDKLSINNEVETRLENIKPEILYLISKFSDNRISSMGYKSKQKIVESAFDNINLNTDLLQNLAYEFLYNYDRFTIYKAEEIFTILSKIYPKNVKFIVELAFARRLLNKMDSSLELMAKAIELDPTNWYYLYSYGTQLYVKDSKKAKDIFLEAIEMGDSLNSNLYLGKIYYDEENYEKALFFYRERVRHSFGPDDEFKLQALKGIRRSLKKIEEKE